MPKRKDLQRIVILGSGPIVIGQACEFDYSGTQACKALMSEGYEVVLINSNPATIMTDPEIATRTYVEPLTPQYVQKILEIERPQGIIATLGGQTALNLGLTLQKSGFLKSLEIELLGTTCQVIEAAEDREKFRNILDQISAKYPSSVMVRTLQEGLEVPKKFGFPLILRPNYTLGGGGGGIAYTFEEYELMISAGLKESPTTEVLVEESILGWKEFELEVMRDSKGTFVVICSIENLDPCGVHTGDSVTVAPQQTLSDTAYQAMRDEAKLIIETIGLETGGANVQFAVHPNTGERVVIEMNPRVSRSSALASKATGFPIAKIAALLAVGYHLDEITNDITKSTPCSFEPALDYVVTKIPRFAFEKFAGSQDLLTTQMKSVGEVMSIGRTFKESLGKALSSLEFVSGFDFVHFDEKLISYPNSKRLLHIAQGFRQGMNVEDIHRYTQIDPWFLEQIQEVVAFEKELLDLTPETLLVAKQMGLSDAHIAACVGLSEIEVREKRWNEKIEPGFYQVDTCAGEFRSSTPYFYSTYWARRQAREQPTTNASLPQVSINNNVVAVLGSGPNRIGQGIEFDYCCVRGVKKLRDEGFSVVMINSNPETVSTDYDTADELFFEPLTTEHILEVFRYTQPFGFVAQLGGQTPIEVAPSLVESGFKLLGTSVDSVDLAEDRARFTEICKELQFTFPEAGMASTIEQALEVSARIGYPLICRPSYVLGGRRMQVVEEEDELIEYFERNGFIFSEKRPCLMDHFLEGALEVDVDLVRGKDWSVIGGIVEHIEAAGVHSGDSMGVLPPQRLKQETADKIEIMANALADRLAILGHLNLQLAIKNDIVYILEANPRSSRSVPFVCKATKIPLVDLAIEAMMNIKNLSNNLKAFEWRSTKYVSVKGVVFPFKKFRDSDSILGPEMKSTGESMGRGKNYSEALLKAMIGSHMHLPKTGEVFLSLREKDKTELLPMIKKLKELGFTFSGTFGTATYLNNQGVACEAVKKVREGRPHCVDRIRSGSISLVINTTSGRKSIEDSFSIRRSCIDFSVPCVTESQAAEALVLALRQMKDDKIEVYSLNS